MTNITSIKTVVTASGNCGDIARAAIGIAFERNEKVEYLFNGKLVVVDPKELVDVILRQSDPIVPDPELPACSAIRVGAPGFELLLAGKRHPDIMEAMAKCGIGFPREDRNQERQGFMTNRGRWVGRLEARKLMDAAGKSSAARSQEHPDGFRGVSLYSEDLY